MYGQFSQTTGKVRVAEGSACPGFNPAVGAVEDDAAVLSNAASRRAQTCGSIWTNTTLTPLGAELADKPYFTEKKQPSIQSAPSSAPCSDGSGRRG